MSRSDFFKQLFLTAVSTGQIHAQSSSEDATSVMNALMDRYLDAAQNLGRRPQGGRPRGDRATLPRRRIAEGDAKPADQRRGGLPW